MRKALLTLAPIAILALSPTAALADGTVPGAAGGAITGAVVGGPVGAAIGGIVGAVLGTAVDPPPTQVVAYVDQVQPPRRSSTRVVSLSAKPCRQRSRSIRCPRRSISQPTAWSTRTPSSTGNASSSTRERT